MEKISPAHNSIRAKGLVVWLDENAVGGYSEFARCMRIMKTNTDWMVRVTKKRLAEHLKITRSALDICIELCAEAEEKRV